MGEDYLERPLGPLALSVLSSVILGFGRIDRGVSRSLLHQHYARNVSKIDTPSRSLNKVRHATMLVIQKYFMNLREEVGRG